MGSAKYERVYASHGLASASLPGGEQGVAAIHPDPARQQKSEDRTQPADQDHDQVGVALNSLQGWTKGKDQRCDQRRIRHWMRGNFIDVGTRLQIGVVAMLEPGSVRAGKLIDQDGVMVRERNSARVKAEGRTLVVVLELQVIVEARMLLMTSR